MTAPKDDVYPMTFGKYSPDRFQIVFSENDATPLLSETSFALTHRSSTQLSCLGSHRRA